MSQQWIPSLDPLIGRATEVAQLLELARTSRLVTLTGAGGSGKTRLALAVATELERGGRDTAFVDCSSALDRSLVPHLIAASLDVAADSNENPLGSIAHALSGRELSLVLDNLEQIAGIDDLVIEILSQNDNLNLVATSRRALGIRGELEYPVPPLAMPEETTGQALEASPAGALFLARARAVGGSFALEASSAAAVTRLLERLDGLPLAIELAAARTRAMSAAEILQRLDEHGIEAIEDGIEDDHHSLRAVLDWTLGQLARADRLALEAMSVCGGFDAELIDALQPGGNAIGAIESLLGLGLVQRSGELDGVSRFRVLETIRRTVIRAADASRVVNLQQRHARYFTELAGLWDRPVPTAAASRLAAHLDAEADNIRRALSWLILREPREALELLSHLEPYFKLHPRGAEGDARFREPAAAATEPSPEPAGGEGVALRAASRQLRDAWLLLSAKDYHELAEWALGVARSVGDPEPLAESLRQRAYLAYNENDPPAMEAAVGELEALLPHLGERARLEVLDVQALRSELVEGRTSNHYVELLESYIAELRAAGEASRLLLARRNLAGAYLGRREFAKAAVEAGAIAEEFRALRNRPDTAASLAILSAALASTGRLDDAVAAVLECAEIALDVGHRETVASGLWAAIPVALAAGQPKLAVTLYGSLTRGHGARGEIALNALDAELARGWVADAGKGLSPVAAELALREGEGSEPVELLRGLPEALRQRPARPAVSGGLRHGSLTRREIEVMTLVGRGRSDPEIAAELFISPKTASVHLANIKAKLGLESRLQVALRAREIGLTDREPG